MGRLVAAVVGQVQRPHGVVRLLRDAVEHRARAISRRPGAGDTCTPCVCTALGMPAKRPLKCKACISGRGAMEATHRSGKVWGGALAGGVVQGGLYVFTGGSWANLAWRWVSRSVGLNAWLGCPPDSPGAVRSRFHCPPASVRLLPLSASWFAKGSTIRAAIEGLHFNGLRPA